MANLNRNILQYISLREGTINTAEIDRALGIITPKERAYRRVILKRFCDKGILEQVTVNIKGQAILVAGHYKIRMSF